MVKTTPGFFAGHMRRWIVQNWLAQGKLKIRRTTSKETVERHGFEVIDMMEYLKPPKNYKPHEPVVGLYDLDVPLDKNHPDYKQTPCFMLKDENVLLEGLDQAKALTNTVEISEGLPLSISERESSLSLPDEFHEDWIKRIKVSYMFDATQEKLPKKRDPARPMHTFKRLWGLTNSRKLELMSRNLVTACEQFADNIRDKSVIFNSTFSAPFEAHGKKLNFNLGSEAVVTTKNKLQKMANPTVTESVDLPNLYPVDCTVSLHPVHFYSMENIYPVSIKSKWPFVQMAFVMYNPLKVKNLYGEPVTESQIFGRSLMKGFTIAVAQARQIYGDDVEVLPEPVVVPVVQTNGKWFHFTVYQLNTTALDKNSQVKNIFWQSPMVNMFDVCEFQKGRPVFEGYNPQVINRLVTLYNFQ